VEQLELDASHKISISAMTEKILNRYSELINEAKDLITKTKKNAFKYEPQFEKWVASSLNLLEKTFGNNSYMIRRFITHLDSPGIILYWQLTYLRAILISAKTEIENGFLYDIKFLIAEEFYDSMIDYGKDLLSKNHKIPSGVLGRIVIEDTLKKLCEKNGISIDHGWNASRINAELRKSGVYNLSMQDRIQAFLRIGNFAAHGKDEEFSKKDVEDLFDFVENTLLTL